MNRIIFLLITITLFNLASYSQRPLTVTDYDGNVYNAITIGTQVWMKQNLRVTHFNNGDPMENVTVDSLWHIPYGTNGYCNYNNDSSLAATYGRLYGFRSYYADNLSPVGWHIPTKADWDTLISYLGGANIAGGKLKEIGFVNWQNPNTGATNESYFTALPGGYRALTFVGLGQEAHFWTSSEQNYNFKWASAVVMYFNDSSILIDDWESEYLGLSIRLIRNKNAGIEDVEDNGKINIFPNPATDKITVCCYEEKCSAVQIYNMLGESVMQFDMLGKTSNIDIGNLPRGIYIIRVSGVDFTVQKKLIKN